MNKNTEAFLELVRLGIGHNFNYGLPEDVNWSEIEQLAVQQGLTAIVVDGIE